jgi:hypothetical protein
VAATAVEIAWVLAAQAAASLAAADYAYSPMGSGPLWLWQRVGMIFESCSRQCAISSSERGYHHSQNRFTHSDTILMS